jgi:PiT family inorganic phosphate transporter
LNELLLYTSIGLTLCFAFVNGFHDGGNVIATIVCSRSMRPFKALVLASIAEFVGPLVLGTAVAQTMASSILKPDLLEQLSPGTVYLMMISGVGGAIAWKLPTWIVGLLSSGSHALIGGLIGAGLVAMGTQSGGRKGRHGRGVALLVVIIWDCIGILVFAIIRKMFHRAHRGWDASSQPCRSPP